MAEYGSGELSELMISSDEDPSSSLIPRLKHRQGACNRAPEPVNQPLNPPPSYRATAVKDRPLSATEKTVARPGPAPEGRKGDRVCVRAPDGPHVQVNPQLVPLQPRLIGNSQLPPPQYPQHPPPPRGNVNIVAQQPVELQQPQQHIQVSVISERVHGGKGGSMQFSLYSPSPFIPLPFLPSFFPQVCYISIAS